jgi:UDP-N-acetylmuramoylalanine--D-glutamate ligase
MCASTVPAKGESTSVIGVGASGMAAALLALDKGGEVYVSDTRSDADASARGDELRSLGAVVELGRHDLARIASSEVVVVSPGIPPDAPVLRSLRAGGVAWISEPEYAFRHFQSPLIAVTGTNGKTTTAALAAHLLESSGLTVGLGGNIGAGLGPAASALALREPAPDWLVVEVSSFQLADVVHFRPDIGIVTNLAPDHLDRYPSEEAYYADKARIFENATPESRWVLGAEANVRALAGDASGKCYLFALEEGEDGALTLAMEGREETLIPREELPLFGRHNVLNALAASLAASLAGAAPEAIRSGLGSFPPLPHRLEPVADRDGVLWLNDSKATNVAAAAAAVTSLDRPVVLLLGGKDKGEKLAPLLPALEGRVRRAVVYGAARRRIADALEGVVPVLLIDGSFDDAVRAAEAEARPGDAILLAPACSSYDQFRSYEERGARFAALARGEE